MSINGTAMKQVRDSATGTASHSPSTPKKEGRVISDPMINTNVRKNEMSADIPPFENAENSDEANTLMPANKKFHIKIT